jgi:hypothetical protein
MCEMNVPLNKWKHENLCSERLLLCNSCCYKPHLVTCGNKSILIWDLFLCQYQYAQSLKSEWCTRFSRCSSFWTLAWCSCSCVRGTRCLPCHFGTTWNWRAWARWCTVPGRSPTTWTDESCWSAWTWTGRRSINRNCEFACGCGSSRPTACSATARCHTPMNWDAAGSTFICTIERMCGPMLAGRFAALSALRSTARTATGTAAWLAAWLTSSWCEARPRWCWPFPYWPR